MADRSPQNWPPRREGCGGQGPGWELRADLRVETGPCPDRSHRLRGSSAGLGCARDNVGLHAGGEGGGGAQLGSAEFVRLAADEDGVDCLPEVAERSVAFVAAEDPVDTAVAGGEAAAETRSDAENYFPRHGLIAF